MGGETPAQVVMLVRHGAAMSKEEDPRRSLSAVGREHVERVAGCLAGIGSDLEEVRHSGKQRARETAEIFAARVGVTPERVREANGLNPNDDVDVVAKELEREGRSVALVGHLPFMGRLASRLLSGSAERLRMRFADAGCLVVTRIEGGWRLDGFFNHDLLR